MKNISNKIVILHFQLEVTHTSLRRGLRMVSSATFLTLRQQSTSLYRLLVGFAGSITYGSLGLKSKMIKETQ